MTHKCCRPITTTPYNGLPKHLGLGQNGKNLANNFVRVDTTADNHHMEGLLHPFGTCTKGFDVVCKVWHACSLSFRPKCCLRAPKPRPASEACLGRRIGAWGRKNVSPLPQRPTTMIGGSIQRISWGQGCLISAVDPSSPTPHNDLPKHLYLGQNRQNPANNFV